MPISGQVFPENSRLGRNFTNRITRGVRALTNILPTGFRDVKSDAEFIPGIFGKLVDDAGKAKLTAINAVDDVPIGIFANSKTTSFYIPEVLDPVNSDPAGDDPFIPGFTTNTSVANLRFPNIKEGTLILYEADGTTLYFGIGGSGAGDLVENTDYEVNEVNGTVTLLSTAKTGPADDALGKIVLATYRHKDIEQIGFDETAPSGKSALYEGVGEYAFQTYDTTQVYAIGDTIGITTDGLLSLSEDSGGSGTLLTLFGVAPTNIGVVTKTPTAQDPHLHVKIQTL